MGGCNSTWNGEREGKEGGGSALGREDGGRWGPGEGGALGKAGLEVKLGLLGVKLGHPAER